MAGARRKPVRRWRRSPVIPVRGSRLVESWRRVRDRLKGWMKRRTRRPLLKRTTWLKRHRWKVLIVALVFMLAGTVAGGAFLMGVGYFAPARTTVTGSAGLDQTVLGCVRGATASALSAAVPAAPLAATGVLMPGSAALVATASAIGCGVGAASTTTTTGAEWLLKQTKAWFSGWFGG
ncbi:MAG: hypothetical protein WCF85_13770 [Rhodospirillaceae bacterium]